MVSQQQAREIALGLPEAIEQDHHGRPSFRAAGKIFATLWDEDHMNLMLDDAGIRTVAQREPETCTEFWWGKRLGALQVNLDRVDPDTLADLLTDAWEGKAPSSVVAGTTATRRGQESDVAFRAPALDMPSALVEAKSKWTPTYRVVNAAAALWTPAPR